MKGATCFLIEGPTLSQASTCAEAKSILNPGTLRPVVDALAAAIPRPEVGAVVEKKSNDRHLLVDRAGRAAGARRLHREVKRGRRTLSEATINAGAGFEKSADGGRAARPHRSMQRRGPATIGVLDISSVLEEMADDLG